ncbi:MAG: aminotransferase class III-fold pyridoxal phosphate-dependent enzyme [Verrucomicrobiota bacterium]|nr:aminotransferase class III-fold pyridoxal phosphate-dependent enzyme [Verrucomicrobiota bacterium]
MFAPGIWPAYYSKAKGCRVWDMDGRVFIDMSIMAVGACVLGYADADVDAAVKESIDRGVSSSLNCPEEVQLAEALIELHPWFDMVRFARSGGEALSVAVRIARAKTRRDLVLFSGYHGWTDWYLAANLDDERGLDTSLMPGLEPNGVPRALKGTSKPFTDRDIESLREAVCGQESKIAAIMIEPARGEEATTDYLQALRDIASEIGAVLIFDEITSGFRMCAGGIHRRYEIKPDMAVFAKSLANGYAMSAVLGKEKVMQAAQTTFISSTNWTDRVGPSAALATLGKYKEAQVDQHLISIGTKMKKIWLEAAQNTGLAITVTGLPTLAAFRFDSEYSMQLNTSFVIEMLTRGFLGFRQFKPSFSHSDAELEQYKVALDEVFRIISQSPEHRTLSSPVAHTGFRRLSKE